LFTMEELIVQFQPIKLLDKKISFRAIRIRQPQIFLFQWPDSTWNVTHLTPQNESKPDTSDQQFQWALNVENAAVIEAFLSVKPLDSTSPLANKVADVNAIVSMEFSSKGLDARVGDLELNVRNTPFRINQTSFSFSMSDTLVQVADFDLETEYSSLQGNMIFSLLKTGPVHAEFRAQPLSQKDVRPFLPDLPETSVDPDLIIDVDGQKDSVAVQISARTSEQQLNIDGYVTRLYDTPGYQLAVCFKDFALQDWIASISSKQPVNGCIHFQGKGVTGETLSAEIDARLRGLSHQNRKTDSLLLDATLNNQILDARLYIAAPMGSLDVDARVEQLFEQPVYQLEANGSSIDIAGILQLEQSSDLQFYLNVNGRGIDPATMQAHGDVKFYESSFANIPIDTLQTKFDVTQQVYNVQSFRLRSPLVSAQLSGTIADDSVSYAQFHIQPKDLTYLSTWIENPPKIKGDIQGTLSGSLSKLNVQSQLQTDVRYQAIRLDSLSGNIDLKLGEQITSTFKLTFREGMVNTIPLDDFQLTGRFTPDSLSSDLQVFHHDTNKVIINSHLVLDSLITITIEKLRWDNGKTIWNMPQPQATITIGPHSYSVDSLELVHNDQLILIDGFYAPSKNQKANIIFRDVEIYHITKWLQPAVMPAGTLQTNIELDGTAANPVLDARIDLMGSQIQDYQVGTIQSSIQYQNEQASVSLNLYHEADTLLTIDSSTQISVSLDTSNFNLALAEPIQLDARARNLNLDFLNAYLSAFQRFEGQLNFNINSPEAMNTQQLNGELSFQNGVVALSQTRTPYKNIRLNLTFSDNVITLQEFQAQSGDGNLKMNGSITLSQQLSTPEIESFQINVNADDFTASQRNALELVFDSDLTLNGDVAQPTFGGDITVLHSTINLSKLQGTSPGREELDPFLIREKQTVEDTSQEQSADLPDFVDRLRGQGRIDIPRNTWLRSDDMNIEISGVVDVVKQSEDFEFFGTIQTIRGTYSFYGKRFILQSGTITLLGGAELNPALDLTADYRFRDVDGDKRTLTINVTDRLSSPNISFSLDGTPIEQKDGISYLLFGRSTQQLSHSEKTQMSETNQSLNGAKVSGLLYGQIASQLSSRLQKNLDLDVIEFTGDANWRRASVVVGKYITNDLFLRYEREFSFGQTEDAVPQKVSLEYEIARFLYLQATKGDPKSTGFDLIFKFEEGK